MIFIDTHGRNLISPLKAAGSSYNIILNIGYCHKDVRDTYHT